MKPNKCSAISRLLALVAALYLSAFSFAQQQAPKWTEYVFADDGFAITVPSKPIPHPSGTPQGTAYSVSIGREIRLSIFTSREKVADCRERIEEVKQRSLSILGDRINSSSLTNVIFDNAPGLEYEWRVGLNRQGYALHFCADSRLFSFSAEWPNNERRPQAIARITKSFRLISR